MGKFLTKPVLEKTIESGEFDNIVFCASSM